LAKSVKHLNQGGISAKVSGQASIDDSGDSVVAQVSKALTTMIVFGFAGLVVP
jgi:hypothetical protein